MIKDDDNVLSALAMLPVSRLTYREWVNVGMALHNAGMACSVWDAWSQNDVRYHAGECDRKWNSFRDSANPITIGTIFMMAKEYGWNPKDTFCMGWEDEISDGGGNFKSSAESEARNQVKDFVTYLEVLFDPEDIVGYVTNDVYLTPDGRWVPLKGVYNRTAGELIASAEKHPDDLGATIGDWKPDAGAWIRINALDGGGVANDNVSKFRYALVESDTMPIARQDALYRELELPIACLVHSGGKSLHAIVRIDAPNAEEYRKRVDFLYEFLEKHGVRVDKQNRNPSRLSRLPGATRKGVRQKLVATNIGGKDWEDWMDFVQTASDDLPDIVPLSDFRDNPPPLPEELIQGILRCGHKMLISGSSKAGKSFLLMELAIAIAEGTKWLTFPCKKGRVLYVNLEIDRASCIDRFLKIYEALDIPKLHLDDIRIWNLRGHAVPLDKLVPKLIRRIRKQDFDAIIIDPIYKVITGDENNASEMGAFCNQFDKICDQTEGAVIYCHHHSKGAQGAKKAMDRASGSGVFARDPDAQLDIIQLELPDSLKNDMPGENATAWRMESSLREFPNIQPVNFWFEYPIHRVDESSELDDVGAEGSFQAARAKNKKCTTAKERRESVDAAYNACSINPPVTVVAMAKYGDVSERCMRDRVHEFSSDYWCKGGIVGRIEKTEH